MAKTSKRVLALLMAVLMAASLLPFSVIAFAAATTTRPYASDTASTDLTFVVPEAIYLAPDAMSWKNSTSTPFQYYVNNNRDGSVTYEAAEKIGKIYYYLAGAGSATISGEFLTTELGSLSGGTLNVNDSNAKGEAVSLSISNNASQYGTISGSSPSLAAGTSGCYIRWTLSYTDPKDSKPKKAYAYTYVYKPYVVPVAAAADAGTGLATVNWAGNITWISGVHSISGETSGHSVDSDGFDERNTGKANYTGTYGLSAFISKETTGYVNSDAVSQAAAPKVAKTAWAGHSGTTSEQGDVRYVLFSGNGDNYGSLTASIRIDPSNKGPGNYMGGTTFDINNFEYAKHSKNNTDCVVRVRGTYRGELFIDSSRYTNLSQIPNLAVGFLVIDDENSASNTGNWYVADSSGVSSTKTDVYWTTDGDNRNAIYNEKNYIIAAQTDGSATGASYDESEGLRYAGMWPRTLKDVSGGGSYRYTIHGFYVSRVKSWGSNYDAGGHSMVALDAFYRDKANLRAAVQRAIKKMPALGVNGISGSNITSCYFDSGNENTYNWIALQTAFTNACKALTRVDGGYSQTEINTYTTNLNNALNNLKTKVTFNGNGVSLDSSVSTQYVTVGTNQNGTVSLPTAPTYQNHTFQGWSKDATATTGQTGTMNVGYNETIYAIWSKNPYTITYNSNGGSGTPPANQTNIAFNSNVTLQNNTFTRNAFKVTFNGNGGTPDAANRTSAMDFRGWGFQKYSLDTNVYRKDATSSSSYLNIQQYELNGPHTYGEKFFVEFDAYGSGQLATFFYNPDAIPTASALTSANQTFNGSDGRSTHALTNSFQHYSVLFTLANSGGSPDAAKYILGISDAPV